jgi:hypothetical protein
MTCFTAAVVILVSFSPRSESTPLLAQAAMQNCLYKRFLDPTQRTSRLGLAVLASPSDSQQDNDLSMQQ